MSGFVFLEASELSVGEADGEILVPVVRTGDLSAPVTVTFGITGLDATPGEDFEELTGTIIIPVDVDRAWITVDILDDFVGEPSETLVVSIINIDSGTLQAPRTARVVILDDETPATEPPEPPLTPVYDVAEEIAVSGLSNPIDIQFIDVPAAPDGSQWAYVAEKSGRIKLVDTASGEVVSEFIDLTAQVANDADRGLLDIVVHPDFPAEPYIYAFYVVDPPDTIGNTGNDGPNGAGNRFSHVVRFTADADNDYQTAVDGSAQIIVGAAGQLLTDISGDGAVDSTTDFDQPESGVDPDTGEYIDDYLKVDSRSHAGGALAFGPDGALYISTGDGTSFNFADPRALSVQDINSLSGKILRVDPDTGLGLPDNPFADQADSLASNAAKVYQLGLRNPFSMAFDENGNLFITETGWDSYEEINSGGAGANFGWPFYEGGDNGTLVEAPGYSQLPEAQAFYADVAAGTISVTAAYRGYSHNSADPGYQIQSITGGGVVYTGDKYPALFQNDYFFADFSQGEIFTIDTNDRRDVSFLYNRSGEFGPVHFEQGPDGYVYYVDIVAGEIGRLLITGGPADELAPIATDDVGATDPSTPAPSLNVLVNDIDPDGSSADLVVSAVSSSAANVGAAVTGSDGGQFTIASDGTASFDPNGDFDALAPGASATTSVEYVVRDPDGREAVATYAVTVAAPGAGLGSSIQIRASGQSGEESIALLIDDEVVATFDDVAIAGETLNYQSDEAGITADRVKVAFTNDLYDPNTGVDRNVTIESVTIDGTAYLTDDPSVFSTGSWQLLDGVVPGFGRGNVLHTDGFFAYGQAAELGSILTIDAAGATGFEIMELLIDGAVVATFENVADALTTYTYQADTTVLADQVRVQFTNDVYDPANGIDYNLFVERITIDDRVFQTDDPSVFSTGTWLPGDGTEPGFGRGDTLNSNGYFQYQEAPPPDGSVIEIFAAGAEGAEIMELFINGALKARFEDIPVLGDTFVFQSDEIITADQVRVAFVNDVYDPANGIDYNLIVDKISIDTLVFETENPNVFSTGTWLPEDGVQPGFGRGETLTSNGYFQYSSLGADDFSDV
ncbi:MAG: carbohydrate-binding domain-containing protein [Pseudomonadota bacterium]